MKAFHTQCQTASHLGNSLYPTAYKYIREYFSALLPAMNRWALEEGKIIKFKNF